MKPVQGLAVLVVICLMTSCGVIGDMRNLGRNLEEIQQSIQVIAGEVKDQFPERSQGNIIVVLLSQDTESQRILSYKIMTDSSEYFVFPQEVINSRLVAFKDSNNNFIYDKFEPIAESSGEIKFSPHTLIEDELEKNVLVLDYAPDATREYHLDLSSRSVVDNVSYMKNMGKVTDFSDANFSDEVEKMGLWEPLRFAREVGYGFYLLEPWDPDRDVVLFVHGINSSPKAWQNIIPKLNFENYQPVLFQYPSGFNLEASASVLSNIMAELYLRDTSKRIRVVAHSMGGLITQRFIQMHLEKDIIEKKLDRVMTISTPWAGHKGAQLGVDYSPVVAPVWYDMAPDSPFLASLFTIALPDYIEHTVLFSYAGQSGSAAANDGTVTLESQLDARVQNQASRLIGLNENHVSILSSERTAEYINTFILID